ncbi:MAG: hypothetical protein RLZZ450_5655 [Pseudomonadota bacterium]
MNKHELRARLIDLNVLESAYCLEGGLPSESYTLAEEAGRWQVYYSERGQRSSLVEFDDESSACLHLLGLVEGDRTTRRR